MYNFFKKTVLALLLVCALCAVTCLVACGQSPDNPQYGQTGNNGSAEKVLTGTDIKTLNLKIDGSKLSVTVSDKTKKFSFIDEITVADGASWKVYSDSDCLSEVDDKTINLIVGDNVFYVAVTNGYNTKIYIATITYKPITYTVTFDTKGGTEVKSQTVEEDCTITAPETSREGYSFVKWDYDFTQPITKNLTASAEWSADVTLTSDGTVTGLNNNVSDLVILSEYDGVAVKAIAENAFKNCANLKSVTIPNCIKSFPEGVFSGCSGLKEMTIPFVGAKAETSLETARYPFGYLFGTDSYVGGIKTMQQYYYISHNFTEKEYYIPKNLRKITITESVTDFAFYKCNSLVIVTIGDNVKSIGEFAFNSCSSLTSVVIGSGVTEIDSTAFYYSNKLTEVVNRSDLIITKGDTDNGYAGYYALDVHDGESKIDDKDGYLFYTYESVNYLLGYVGNETDLTLPSDYNGENYEIYNLAFYNSDSLKNVIIPNGVTSIRNSAFDGCNALISVKIDGATSVKDYAFYGCTALVSITVGENVTSIADNAFWNCYKLIEVIDKSSLEIYKGGTNNNGYIGCYALDVHNGESKIDKTDDGYMFYTYDQVNYLVGYAGTETDLTLPNNYHGENYEIYKFAFYGNNSMTSVIISDGITSIGRYAFASCDELTSVTIGSDVTVISVNAFSFSYSLDKVTFENPNGWYSISSTGTTNDLNLEDASQNATKLKQTSNTWKRN